jgi:hypothetical protein
MAAFSPRDIQQVHTEAPSDQASQSRRTPVAALAETMARQSAAPAASPVVLAGLVRLADFCVVAASGASMYWLYLTTAQVSALAYSIAIPSLAALTVVMFQALGLNHVGAFRTPVQKAIKIVGGFALLFLAAMAAIFFLKLEGMFSRVWMLGWFSIGALALLLERGLVSIIVRAMTRVGRLDRRTVIVGGGTAAVQLLDDLARQKDTDLRILGVFDDRADDRTHRRLSQAWHGRRSRRIRPPRPHRSRDLRHADHRRAAPPANAAQIVGSAD